MMTISLRACLLCAFLLGCGAPLAVFWLWPQSSALEREMADVRKRHTLLARNLAQSVAVYHDTLTGAFAAVAPLAAEGRDLPLIQRLLAPLSLRHVCVADAADGRVLRDVTLQGAPCPDVVPPARLAQVTAMLADGKARVSGAVPIADGAPGLLVAQAVGDMIVIGAVSTDHIGALADALRFGEGGHAAVFDADGRVLAHPDPVWVQERRDVSALAIVRAALAGESGVREFVSPALDAPMIAGHAPVGDTGWAVMTPQPVAEITAKLRAAAVSNVLTFAAGLGLSALIALYVAQHLSRRIRAVSCAAERMAAGDNGARVPQALMHGGVRELASLATSFNLMAGRVERAHLRIAEVARHDPLTGLLNRGGFFDDSRAALGAGQGGVATMFFIDIDDFKHVNDTYGHAVGDRVLCAVADRLRAALGDRAVIARQGGDEFLALAPAIAGEAAQRLGERALRALRAPITMEAREIVVTASIGASTAPRDADGVDALALTADQAMYQAKHGGGGVLRFYDGGLQQRLDEDARLIDELRDAIAAADPPAPALVKGASIAADAPPTPNDNRLEAAFQPIIHARSGALTGFETLARWRSPTLGEVPPERFVAAAEQSGLIVALGRQVREHAFVFAARLRRSGLDLPVSVNVSQAELASDGFAPALAARLAAHELPHRALVLEITESVFRAPGQAAIDALFALRRRGVSFALDDFGKGFCAHRLLRTYPVDRLKIAADFMGDVTTDPGARAVVRSMIDLGRRLNLGVTVENVETKAQRDLVTSLGADEIQGFWHHAPMSSTEAAALAVRATRRLSAARAG